jgi:hypothetical protein
MLNGRQKRLIKRLAHLLQSDPDQNEEEIKLVSKRFKRESRVLAAKVCQRLSQGMIKDNHQLSTSDAKTIIEGVIKEANG